MGMVIRFHYTDGIQLQTVLFFLEPIVADYTVTSLEEEGMLAEVELEI